MTEPTFRQALETEYADNTPRESIQRIKSAVIRGLEGLDARARIHNTDYFNHTFAPDLVLRWGEGRERYVYVRLTNETDALVEDIGRVASQKPIIFEVAPRRPLVEEAGARAVQDSATAASTLVTNAGGLATLAEAQREEAVVGLLTGALAEHGRGVLDDQRAASATAAVSEGFAGARNISPDPVLRATNVVDALLDGVSAARMHRLLQAVWIGSGGRSDLFPARTAIGVALDDESLSFLLDQDEIEDLEFWRRISSGLDLQQIGRLTAGAWTNLRWLISANLDRLKARVCHVVDAQETLDQVDALSWVVHRGRLALRSTSFYVYVAELTDHLQDIPGSPTEGITIDELKERSSGRASITSVWLADAREEVAFSSVLNEDVTQSAHLEAVASAMGGSRVRRARAVLPGDKGLTADFASSSASSVTRGTLSLPEILGYGLPLLRPLSAEIQALLDDLLRDPFGEEQPTLFDEPLVDFE